MKAAREFLKGVEARGGTNIHDALLEALRQPDPNERLPIVLFLTDGLPTIGKTGETEIRRLAETANPHHRRIFTFGVGADVNTPLLDRLASETRGTASFVLPGEDTGMKISQVFKRLNGPVLADPVLELFAKDGKPAAGRVRDLFPGRLPDFFEGDSLVLLGQYVGEAPLSFKLRGNDRGRARTFSFELSLDKATTRNAFVPRLWASRKIGGLIEAIRQATADAPGGVASRLPSDPKMKELVDEVVRLSKEFGVLTEYTAFLVREGTDLGRPAEMQEMARRSFGSRMGMRSGVGSVNQERNDQRMREQSQLNISNGFFDPEMNVASAAAIQQVNDRAFFRRGGRWVDSRVASETATPAHVVEFGSEEFRALAGRLALQNAAGTMSLRGEVLIAVDGETVLVRNPTLSAVAETQLRANGERAARSAAAETLR